MELVKHDYNTRSLAAGGFVLLGVLLLFGISHLWPLFILVPGLGLLLGYRMGGKETVWMAVPGMLVAGTGGLLLFQSITGYWESWAYAWLLYGVFIGTGLSMMGSRTHDRSLMAVGRMMSLISGAAFLGFGFLFILLTTEVFRWLLTLGFLTAGGYLLWREFGGRYEHPAPRKRQIAEKIEPYDSPAIAPLEETIKRIQVEVEEPVK